MRWLADRFELSRGGDAHNLRPMEGLRGLAVFLVFLVHFGSLAEPWISRGSPLQGLVTAIQQMGNAGVDLFFVLSGYLIYGSLIGRQQDLRKFLRRRVVRIYPAFLAVFAIYLLLSYLRPADSRIPPGMWEGGRYLLQNLLLLPGLFPIEPMITVAWSLSYEMFYYLLMPAIIGVFALRARGARQRIAFFLVVGAAFALWCATLGGPVRLLMFVAGIVLYEVQDSRRTTIGNPLALAALAAGLWSTTLPYLGSVALVAKILCLCCAFFAVCLACFKQPQGWLARGFAWTPLRWLGNMSYSYYLLHGLTLKVAFTLLAPRLPHVEQEALLLAALLPPMFLLTLLPAAALFLLIERPLSLAPARPDATMGALPAAR